MRFVSGWMSGCHVLRPQWVYNKKKGGRQEDHLLPHSWVDVKLLSSAAPPGLAGEIFCLFVCLFVLVPIWSNQDCHGTMQQSPLASVQCLSFTLKCHLSINCCFCVCWEHVLGVINLLSSLGRIWVSYHHCVIVFRNILFLSHDFVAKQTYVVLWLNKPAFLSNHWHTVFSHFLLITIP